MHHTQTQGLRAAVAYHEATKHHYHRYAASLGYLDWATQPNPFRRFEGARQALLPFVSPAPAAADPPLTSPRYDALYLPGAVPAHPVTAASIGAFLEHAMAISAWKSYQGSRWALRCNPSSGNLHPVEAYLLTRPIAGLCRTAAVFHYTPEDHGLEERASFDAQAFDTLASAFPPDTFLTGLTSVHWRETWKYGERAWRYCQLDLGHAFAACVLSAAALGWRMVFLEGLSDDLLAGLLGIDRQAEFHPRELEYPGLVMAAVPTAETIEVPRTLPAEAVQTIAGGPWHGHANVLSRAQVEWEVIDEVTAACHKPAASVPPIRISEGAASPPSGGPDAWQIIKQRRSAVEMDGRTALCRDAFYRMLARTVPALCPAPWEALGPPAAVHLGLFVHRVEGLSPGLYCLARDPDDLERVQAAMDPDFAWIRPEGCPKALPLFLLKPGNCQRLAAQVSCGQSIAGDSAFSLGMLARFEYLLEHCGAWYYRRLFWECGAVGQVLYLEAEAEGVRATGIGCFFDDPVHEVFGLRDHRYQSLYHFTVGGPVEDTRLSTLPPYSAARRAKTVPGR